MQLFIFDDFSYKSFVYETLREIPLKPLKTANLRRGEGVHSPFLSSLMQRLILYAKRPDPAYNLVHPWLLPPNPRPLRRVGLHGRRTR